MEIVVHLMHHHRNPEVYPNPTKYDPERFFAQHHQRHPYDFIPFSAGARNCIGQKFAEMEQKVALAAILRKYDLKTNLTPEEVDDGISVALVLSNKTDLSIYYMPRQ